MRIFHNHRDAYKTAKDLGYKWVAMDSGGAWWAYMTEPRLYFEEGLWFSHKDDLILHIGNMDPADEHWPSTKLEVKRWRKEKA